MAVKVKIKTIWNGMVAVKSQAIEGVRATNDDMLIDCSGQQMLIKKHELMDKVVMHSENYKDKYGGKDYSLYYFKFIPTKEDLNQLNIFGEK